MTTREKASGAVDGGIVRCCTSRLSPSSACRDVLTRAYLHMIDLGGDVTGNGISKLVFTILSAVAEAERDRIRERVAQVKQDQKDRGRYLGGKVPFGFRVGDDGSLVPDAAEQAVIAHAHALRADGATLRAIQAVLETQHGRKLSLDALHRVLAQQRGT